MPGPGLILSRKVNQKTYIWIKKITSESTAQLKSLFNTEICNIKLIWSFKSFTEKFFLMLRSSSQIHPIFIKTSMIRKQLYIHLTIYKILCLKSKLIKLFFHKWTLNRASCCYFSNLLITQKEKNCIES